MKKQSFHPFSTVSLISTSSAVSLIVASSVVSVIFTGSLLLCIQVLTPLSVAAADDQMRMTAPVEKIDAYAQLEEISTLASGEANGAHAQIEANDADAPVDANDADAPVDANGALASVETAGANGSTGAIAGGSTGNAAMMTESQAIEQALKQSRNLMFLQTDVEIAEYQRDSAGSLDNPELRLENSMDRSGKNQGDEYQLGFRWRPPGYGERSEDRLEASVDSSRKRIEALRYRHRLISRVRKDYADALMKDDLAELARHRLDLETRRLGIVEQMVALGRRSIVYMTKARMWLAETRHEYAQSLKRQKSARRNLSQLTGEPEDIALVCAEIPMITQDVDVLTSIAMDQRPETELANLQTELAIQRSRVEKFKLVPRMTFVDMSYSFEENRDDRMEMRMGIELPFFRWNKDYVKARELAVRRKEIESSASREQIKDEISEAYEVYLDCLSDWQNFNDDITGMIAETEQVIRQAGENQVLDPDEVLELDLVLVKTRQILVEKRCRLAMALADLYFAMGIEENTSAHMFDEMISSLAGK